MEKSCIFYASKYHLSLILLEFLKNKNIKKYTVKTFLQNPIEYEILNLKNKYKIENKQIDNIDFKKTKEIKQKKIDKDKNQLIIIAGDDEYLSKVCKYIEKTKYKKGNIKMICCYNYKRKKKDILETLENNNSIVTTTGEKHLTNWY